MTLGSGKRNAISATAPSSTPSTRKCRADASCKRLPDCAATRAAKPCAAPRKASRSSASTRALAGLLLELAEVVGVDRAERFLIVRAKNPRRFFERLGELALDRMIEIQHLETLDESTHDVLGYLLGAKRP